MGFPESDRNAVLELAREERAGQVVEKIIGSEVVAEPEAGEVELTLASEQPEVRYRVFAKVARISWIFADDLKGTMAEEHAESLAEADGVRGLDDERAARPQPGGHAGEDMGWRGVEVFDDFGHYDNIVRLNDRPGGGVRGVIEIEVNMMALQLAGKAVIEVANRIDGNVEQRLLEKEGLMGEANIEDAFTPFLRLHDTLDRVEKELVSSVMET